MNYNEYLKSDYWKSVREAAKKRDGYKCKFCSRSNGLAVHHNSYAHLGRELEFLDDVVCVCGVCHNTLHGVMEINGVMRPTIMPVKWTPKPAPAPAYVPAQRTMSKRERKLLNRQTRAVERLEASARRSMRATAFSQNPVDSFIGPKISDRKREKIEKRIERKSKEQSIDSKVASFYDHNADMPKAFPFVMDRPFLLKLRTIAGGYTAKTLTAIGVALPPVSGWPTEQIGKTLTEDQCRLALIGRECRGTLRTLARRNNLIPDNETADKLCTEKIKTLKA